MRVTILQHSDGTPPGSVTDWLTARGHAFQVSALHRGEALPSLSETDALVILGGPMNVDDEKEFPWLKDEKLLLREAIRAKKPCLGLCLGGQLLSVALGGRVGQHTHWEVGWHSVDVEGGQSLNVFQWHQDTFTIPEGAKRIASNAITDNQGFRFGEHVLAFQFHPEATAEWVRECTEENPYPTGPYVQNAEKVLEGLKHLSTMREWFFGELDRFFRRP